MPGPSLHIKKKMRVPPGSLPVFVQTRFIISCLQLVYNKKVDYYLLGERNMPLYKIFYCIDSISTLRPPFKELSVNMPNKSFVYNSFFYGSALPL